MDLVFSLNQSQNELAQNQNQTQNLRNCVHGFRIGKVKKKQIFKENKVVLFFYIFIWIFRRGRLWWCLMSNGSSTKHERDGGDEGNGCLIFKETLSTDTLIKEEVKNCEMMKLIWWRWYVSFQIKVLGFFCVKMMKFIYMLMKN